MAQMHDDRKELDDRVVTQQPGSASLIDSFAIT